MAQPGPGKYRRQIGAVGDLSNLKLKNPVEVERTLKQQKEISLMASSARNDLAQDFNELLLELKPKQINAIVKDPWTMKLFFGTAVERRVARQMREKVAAHPDHLLSDLKWTRLTNAPQDFINPSGYGFDLTGSSPTSILKHQRRRGVDSVITYQSIPNDLGYKFREWLKDN